MLRRLLLAATLALVVAGCGGSAPERKAATPTPTPVGTDPVDVVRAWSEALRHDDIDRATSLFALPALVANGTGPYQLESRAEVGAFNEALPCGARLIRTRKVKGGRLLGTFTLTERPGAPAPCGAGPDARAGVVFKIRGGRIVEWLRAQPDAGPARTPRPQL